MKGKKEAKKHLQKSEDIEKEYIKIDFISKIKNMFVFPGLFFDKIKKEKLQDSLKLFFGFYILSILVVALISIYQNYQDQRSIYIWLAEIIYSTINGLFYIGLIFFLLSYIIFLVAKIFSSKKDFLSSSKIVLYSIIIWFIYYFISLIFFYLFTFDNSMLQALQVTQNKEVQKEIFLSFLKQPGAIINLMITLIAIIHIFIFSLIGVSKFYDIKKGKAFVIIIISWIIFAAIIGLLFFILLMALFV
ncbi:MAG: YIP1 family protein [Candidatus Pacearchaeota archaeon]